MKFKFTQICTYTTDIEARDEDEAVELAENSDMDSWELVDCDYSIVEIEGDKTE